MTQETFAPRHLMPARRFAADQRRHFVWAVAAPTLATVSGPLWLPEGWLDWHWAGLALLMWWLVGCWGVTVGFHRLFSHRAFTAPPVVRYALGALGSMAAQGSVTYWVALHRCHHTLSDTPGDPHSPARSARPGSSAAAAFWAGHLLWTWRHDVPKPTRFAIELLADPVTQALTRQYRVWVGVGVVLPALVGWAWVGHWHGAVTGAWWGGALRQALGHHIIWAINSVCHTFGKRPNVTADSSTNVAWLSLISWGESWHNNHHAAPTSAQLGWSWKQPDVGWWCVATLQKLGPVTRVRIKAEDQ